MSRVREQAGSSVVPADAEVLGAGSLRRQLGARMLVVGLSLGASIIVAVGIAVLAVVLGS